MLQLLLPVTVFYIACHGINACGSRICIWRCRRLLKKPFERLPDIGHDYLPRIPHYTPDILMVPLFLLTVVVCALLVDVESCCLLLIMHGLLSAGRGLCSCMTSFPSCMPDTLSPSWQNSGKGSFMRVYDSLLHTPHDLMYSGHTIVFLVCSLAWQHYIPVQNSAILLMCRWCSHSLAVVGPVSLVASHQHYTMDVIVSILMTSFLLSSSIPGVVLSFFTG